MKKLSKLMVLLLSLLMILSLFAACGDDKKDDDDDDEKKEKTSETSDKKDENEALTGEDLLIGEWTVKYEAEGAKFTVQFAFDEDGTFETILTEEAYYDIMDQSVAMAMEQFTEEELAAEGFESEEDLRDYFIEETPYEDAKSMFEYTSTWELDGDTLTLEQESGGTMTGETKLSEGKASFTLESDEGIEFKFSK